MMPPPMRPPQFCSRCSTQLKYSERVQRMACPKCTKVSDSAPRVPASKPKQPATPEPSSEQKTPEKMATIGPNEFLKQAKASGKARNSREEHDLQTYTGNLMLSYGWLPLRINSGGVTAEYKGRKRFVAFYYIFGIMFRFASRGFPDLVGFRDNEFLMIEIKKPGEELSDAQQEFHRFAQRFGVFIEVVDNEDAAREVVQERGKKSLK